MVSECLPWLTGTRPSHDDGTTAAPLPLLLFPLFLLLVLELPPRHLNFGRTNDDVQLSGGAPWLHVICDIFVFEVFV